MGAKDVGDLCGDSSVRRRRLQPACRGRRRSHPRPASNPSQRSDRPNDRRQSRPDRQAHRRRQHHRIPQRRRCGPLRHRTAERHGRPQRRRAARAAPAAQSLLLLYSDDRRGVGKRTSDLVGGITEAFELLAAEPFAAARAPVRFQSALARAACAYLFALMVVACTPEAERAKVEILNRLATEHVLILLCASSPDARSSQLLFKLTVRAVLQMTYDTHGEKLRRQWATAEELPAFARALALWSSPALVGENKALAAALFRRTAEPPLSRGARGLQISRMLTLLDLGVSACIEAGRRDLVRDLIELWAEVYKDWQPLFPRGHLKRLRADG